MSNTKYGCTKLPEDYRVNAGRAQWQRHNITWHLLNADDITYNEVKPICIDAFNHWQDAFDAVKPRGKVFNFMPVADARKADIMIVFCTRNHKHMTVKDQRGIAHVVQCVWDFDGSDGVLAHAFSLFSSYNAGQVHIDKGEDFTKVNLKEILLHELGHVFHLSHSESKNALMYAAYRGDFDYIGRDDMNGLQAAWGVAKGEMYKKIYPNTHKSLTDEAYRTKAAIKTTPIILSVPQQGGSENQTFVRYVTRTLLLIGAFLILMILYIAFISGK